ncbi:MAG: hypothetical protein HYY40_10725 [Bacteroidetes bacterium]|nr:hypothetical protein [Bacteroidota bacterium]
MYNYLNKGVKEKFIQRSYKGVIQDISYIEGHKNFPDIYFNNQRYPLLLGLNEVKITDYIQIGDSIVKDSGTAAIRVYRRDKNSVWAVKIFK